MSDLPERMWADLDHWTKAEPTRPGYVEYARADLLAAAQAVALERGEKLFAAQARIAELEAALRRAGA